jgi:uncharacterized protein YkwD
VAVLSGQWLTSLPASAVDNSARQAVIDAYGTEFNRMEPASGWAGDQETCTAGSTVSAYKTSVLQRVNWYRAQAGLAPVTLSAQNTAAAQAAALYQSRQGSLSHVISPGTPCYSSEASTGSLKSNLALGMSGVGAINGYITDDGSNNTAVGHRAWIFSRTLGTVATGDVQRKDGYWDANALYVVGDTVPAVTPRDGYVAWPNPGFFPDAVLPQRWSFHPVESVDFSSAQVTLTGPSGAVATTIVHRSGYLVFETPVSGSVTADTTYSVAITGAGGGRSWSYSVTLVDVNTPPRYTGASGWSRSTCTAVGTVVRKPGFTDDRGFTASLVEGPGDTDNAKFAIAADGTISTAVELPLDQTKYSVRVRATDKDGAAVETIEGFTLTAAAASTTPCPVRSVRATNSGGKLTVSWDPPRAGDGLGYSVYTDPPTMGCSTTKTTCTITASSSKKYVVKVYATKNSFLSQDVSLEVPAATDGTATTTTSPGTTTKSLKAGTRYSLSKVMRIPAGTRVVSTSGRCRMLRDKKTLQTMSAGTCKVTVRTSRKTGGRTVRSTTRATFTVA